MVIDVEPVAHVGAGSVDWHGLPLEAVEDDERHQLLGEVVGAVVVGAVGDAHRKPVGVVPGAHQVVARGLRGGVGRVRRIRGRLGEESLRAERAVHLVGGDVLEDERRVLPPPAERGLEERRGAEDVGAHELPGAVDRAVDVALGGEVEDGVGPEFAERRGHCPLVTNVLHEQGVAPFRLAERIDAAGVGELVHHQHLAPFAAEVAHQRRADEPASAGDDAAPTPRR